MSSEATGQNFRVRLVIADVDGTLVTNDKVLPTSHYRGRQEVARGGHTVWDH